MAKSTLKQSAAFDADQVEAKAIQEGTASVASATIDEVASGEAAILGEELELSKLPYNQDEHIGAEEVAGRALDAISHRKKRLGDKYPFQINRSQLNYAPSSNGVYEFCLATCLATSNPGRSHRQLLRHFERISYDLVRLHIGGKSVGIRFGSPTEAELDAAPTGFERKVNFMRSKCGYHDEEWTLARTELMKKLAGRQNDARIDFVIRTPFLDDRAGGLTILGQCGCGKNDVDESSKKSEEMTDEWLSFLFAQTSLVKPVKVFATSQHLPNDDEFYFKQGKSQSIFIDRIRMTLMAAEYWDSVNSKYKERIETLTKRIF